ncbi:hypothetical protein AMTR_s00117p00128260 [Amborella trichopoda]|uniref:Peptidase M50 domain-containing protein n=1 Tax=Amborella trichopoda TaxID=13333 RepID=W1NR48_AMBTC|nr:hypothetical protein AMTR_s00117p00128260 [Amborella trichopoda]
MIRKSSGRSVVINVERENKILEIGVALDFNSDGTIGVQLFANFRVSKLKPRNVTEATAYASKEFWALSMKVLDSLKHIFFNFSQSTSKVLGPVAIIAIGVEISRSSTDGLYQFAAILNLNLNLALINLLPSLALDGRSLALLLVEAARGGREIPQKVERKMLCGFLRKRE